MSIVLVSGELVDKMRKYRVVNNYCVKPANSEVVDTEQVLCVSPARNHMESEPGFGFREKSMKR